ncbi:MAG TPA: RNB domain-containing ribonuclease [Candidatus Solibacter sp.]|nr:RNB domain-containing ribonuclease [Candidatus Solibacter sp.]
MVLHQDGYGFVIPDTPTPQLDGDVFVPPNATGDAMHGDHVLVRVRRLGGLTGAQRAEGRIVKILGRAHPTVVGLFRYGPRGTTVLPYDTRIQHEIELLPGQELSAALRAQLGLERVAGEVGRSEDRQLQATHGAAKHVKRLPRVPQLDGAVVNVEILRYPREGMAPTGRVIEILGRPGELGVDTEIIIRKHHLPHEFSAEVLEEAERGAHAVTEHQREMREDFRHLPIVTIDGETARDFDDAVYVEKGPGGAWHLQVHIADVAHYVRTGSALDREARVRGTSVYFPDRAVPMLPEALSNGICSLNPREDRLVMSALMDLDARGNITDSRFTAGVIRSAERMTYTNVNKVLEGDVEMTARYAPLAEHFRNMKELALLLNARRNEKGSIDFDLPQPVIEFDEQQRMTNIVRSERNIAHRLIEEFMLAANRAVDGYLARRGIASLHRVHEKPDARKVLEFEELARAFGYSLGVETLHQREMAVRHGRVPAPAKAGRPDTSGHGRERAMRVTLPGGDELKITPQHYQRLLRKIADKPEERILSYLMLRSLKQARYAADPLGHFALGFAEYTHFTSPIRRYPDLVVHRILKWALAHPGASGKEVEAAHKPRGKQDGREKEAVTYSYHELEEIGAETSESERRAAMAERELMDWKTAQFMEEHLGEEYQGLIISVQKYGCFVELFEVFVEGLLPIGALEDAAGARCVYRERDHAIVAMTGGRQQQGGQRGSRTVGRGRGAKPLRQMEWHLGDRVKVRAERIDPMRKRVEFSIMSEA